MDSPFPKPLSQRLGYACLAALALLHLVFAITYATITPYRTPGYLAVMKTNPWSAVPDIGAPDERQPANYIINILKEGSLPVYRVMVSDPNHPGQMVRNPQLQELYEGHQAPLYYLAAAGYAKLVGLDAESATDPQAGLKLRYLNGLIGALNVAGVFFLALWGVRRRDIAFLAAAITALL